MPLSALDLFSIGIGPSSSHTVGPMRAARLFLDELRDADVFDRVERIVSELFGSLALTGRGHGSDKAVILGLLGCDPETVDTDTADARVDAACRTGRLQLDGVREIGFDRAADLLMHMRRSLPAHPNGMTFTALDADGTVVAERSFYSVGGGFVVDEDAMGRDADDTGAPVALAHPFDTGAELLEICARENLSISEVMLANEAAWRPEAETRARLLEIWRVMQECVRNGSHRTEEVLPGGLNVRRRAPEMLRRLQATSDAADPLLAMDWVNLFALAVNEENASGGRVVTAPTNGAAGIIPAVLHYYTRFVPGADEDGVVRFLLTAAAIGILFKKNASLSGAEVGCQGEVGSACSMAAGGLCEVLGGTPAQVENAAEIGIEHNLGLTCDPVGGLVQVPCIERNALASMKAINAARMSLHGDGEHRISLDAAILSMRLTGADMKSAYKETSQGGLAVSYTEC
ncbi:L-serine ammonia-lyase [Propioniciclava sinopodophylli]|uniref:L-serine dehydratase n=1 Tax=Propioniciclava sinopodophylli TaxID=1837344 RepID=A0A4Q9KCG9_9ACTN|nr:L-serine ammonia-lyase [Propioniciclava sinopodophylli]TBT83964.1 L-serine ammonia-lyase [Propioniciclava sinopodophylli]